MKILCVFGEHSYGDPSRDLGYEYTNFIPALRPFGEVVHFESFSRTPYADFAALNHALVDAVVREDPDVVFCVLMGYELWTETLATLRERTRAALAHWSTDDSWKYRQFSKYIAGYFDVYATTSDTAYEQARRDGYENFISTQWAANADALRPPRRAEECKYAVTFVGSAYGNRPKWIRRLADAGIKVECFGHGWPNGSVATSEISGIIRDSRISLNFGDSGLMWNGPIPARSRQIKARTFEVPGAGGFLLTEPAPGIQRYFDVEKEIACFSSVEELISKIRYFLVNPKVRDAIANAGFQRTRAAHTYDIRIRPLIETALERRAARGGHQGAPERERITAGVVSAAQRHRLGIGLGLLRTFLVAIARVFVGKRRGARAARRLVYELSWRIAGRRTYSSAGWPGRMFYRES